VAPRIATMQASRSRVRPVPSASARPLPPSATACRRAGHSNSKLGI
jgi:hypothetical protein